MNLFVFVLRRRYKHELSDDELQRVPRTIELCLAGLVGRWYLTDLVGRME
jgi:hypothetical protein